MTRLTALAAALAAGLISFAAHSQEAPVNFADAFSKEAKAQAKEKTRNKQERPMISAAHDGRGMSHVWSGGYAKPETEVEKDRPELVTTARKETVLKGVTRPTEGKAVSGGAKYHALVAKYAAAYGVPVQLAHAVIGIESKWRVNATGRAGEVGLMQIKPSTARGLGYSGTTKALYDPATNIRWGMKYLGMAHKLGGGETCGTILKYNAGHGAKRMNPVSRAYCAKVKRQLG